MQHTFFLIRKKKQFCTIFCTFLCRCFARLQRQTSRNFLAARFMEEMSYVLLDEAPLVGYSRVSELLLKMILLPML